VAEGQREIDGQREHREPRSLPDIVPKPAHGPLMKAAEVSCSRGQLATPHFTLIYCCVNSKAIPVFSASATEARNLGPRVWLKSIP
jgi:hypothetical protein